MKTYSLDQLEQRRVHLSMVVNADIYKMKPLSSSTDEYIKTVRALNLYRARYTNLCKIIRRMKLAQIKQSLWQPSVMLPLSV